MRLDDVRIGFLLGMLAPVAGFFLYGWFHTSWLRPHLDMHFFVQELFLGTREFRSPILSLSLIAEVPLFFWLDRRGAYRAMRGVLFAMFLYAIAVVALWI